jgi:hypothetical protein
MTALVILQFKVHGLDITSNANWDTNNSSWGNWTNSGDVDLSKLSFQIQYILPINILELLQMEALGKLMTF